MAIMLATSLSFTSADPAIAADDDPDTGAGVAALLDLDSLVSILLSDADLVRNIENIFC